MAPGEWSDATKYKYETARTIILAILAFGAAYLIVWPLQRGGDYMVHLDRERLALRRATVDYLLRSSYRYTAVTSDVLSREADADVTGWRGPIFDAYNTDMNRLSVYFGKTLDEEVANAKRLSKEIKSHYDAKSDKRQWEPVRTTLNETNNSLARRALNQLGLASP